MELSDNNIKKKIIEVLSKHPEGLKITDIARAVGVHRHTITNYLYEMKGNGTIFIRDLDTLKLCYLARKGKVFRNKSLILIFISIIFFVSLLFIPREIIFASTATPTVLTVNDTPDPQKDLLDIMFNCTNCQAVPGETIKLYVCNQSDCTNCGLTRVYPATVTFGNTTPNATQVGVINTNDTDNAETTFGYIELNDTSSTSVAEANWTWDFGSDKIATFRVKWYGTINSTSGSVGGFPNSYKYYVNFTLSAKATAGTTWTTIRSANLTYADMNYTSVFIDFFGGNYRYIRLNVSSNASSQVRVMAYVYTVYASTEVTTSPWCIAYSSQYSASCPTANYTCPSCAYNNSISYYARECANETTAPNNTGATCNFTASGNTLTCEKQNTCSCGGNAECYSGHCTGGFCSSDSPPTYSQNSTNSTAAGTSVMHSLNWTDDIGLSGYIFSFCNGTWNGTNCGVYNNTVTGGTASASSEYNDGNNQAYRVFDGDYVYYGWGNNNAMPSWLVYDFGAGNEKVVTKYGFICSSSQLGGWGSENYNPMTWTFQGWDGTNWIVLDTISDGQITMDQWKEFPISNAKAYQKYNISITATESGTWVHITEMHLFYSLWQNDTWNSTNFNGLTSAWSNVTKTVNSTAAIIAWCAYANDSSNNWNSTSCQNPFTYNTVSGNLIVNLIYPPSITVDQNSTFNVNASVTCLNAACGTVYGTVRYNGSSSNPDTAISSTPGSQPFYNTSGAILQSCGNMNSGQSCQLNWTLNATANPNSGYMIGVLFNSSYSSVTSNHTNNVTISIITCTESMNIGWTTIDFGTLSPNTAGSNNPALSNSKQLYNITNTGTCQLQVWIKGTDIKNTTLPYPNTINVGDLTWSNTTNSYSNSYVMTYSYVLLNSSLTLTIKNITTYYWLTVPPVYAGGYNGTVYICENTTQLSGSNTCT